MEKITREYLEKNWCVSSYNEEEEDQLDYYIDLCKCDVGDKAYLYCHEEDVLIEMEIIHMIIWSDDTDYYDNLDGDVLIEGEVEYGADTSAEFFTGDDSCLIWFKYVEEN